jgi:hypothetical protein
MWTQRRIECQNEEGSWNTKPACELDSVLTLGQNQGNGEESPLLP